MKPFTFSIALLLSLTSATAAQQSSLGKNPQNPQQTAAAKATIEGTVTRADNGQPLRNARITLNSSGGRAQAPLLSGLATADNRLFVNLAGAVATVVTDSNGRFTITGVDPGQYQISAERDGFVRSEYGQRTPTGNGIAIPVSASQRLTLDLKMLQASVVSGRVITSEGEPASQATVQAYTYQYSNGQRSLAEVKTTQTNDLGEYRLYWLEPGEYFVSVTSNQVEDNLPAATVDVSQSRGGRFARGGAAVQILTTALAERGGPIVQALGGTTNPPVFYPGTMDPDGAVPISVGAAVEVRGTDFNLRPQRSATVSGRVVAPFPLNQGSANIGARGRGAAALEGAPIQLAFGGAPVQLSLNRVGSSRTGLAGLVNLRVGSTPVNADGSFEIKGVAPGEYNLTATARDPSGQQHTARTHVSVANTDVTNVTVAVRPGAEVRGRVLLDGTPPQQFKMSNLRVSLVAEDAALPGVVNFVAAGGGRGDAVRFLPGGQAELAEVADDGSFTLKDIGAMEYRVRVTGLPQGAYLQSGRIDSKDALNAPFTVDSQGAQLQLQLGFSTGRVSGTITDDRGAATQGVQAVLVPDEARRGRSDSYFAATTDQNGQYTFANVPPGRYSLFAWEEVPAGAYQYPDFLRRYEDRGQSVTVNPNGAVTADTRFIPAR
jgi:protocatechuate 3,4-dioxygenase beta subunit